MTTPPSDPRAIDARLARTVRTCICVAAAVLVSIGVSGGTALAEETITFSTPPKAETTPGGAVDTDPDTVEANRLVFHLDRTDRQTRKTAKRASRLTAEQQVASDAATRASNRALAIQELLDQYRDDEARLRAELERRAVAQYTAGEDGDLEFLLAGDGLSDILDRGAVLKDQNASDARIAHEYANTVARLEELEGVLEDLRDVQGERAERIGDRVERLDSQLVSARLRDLDVSQAVEAEADVEQGKDGVNGSWFVMNGAFQPQLFVPMGTSGYNGGTITSARHATPQQIAVVLSDKRIELDASGIGDVSSGQIDGRLLDALEGAAQTFGYVKVTALKSDHGYLTASGNVSEHSTGCAADIGTIGHTYITPGAQVPGGEVETAVRFFAGLPGDLAPHQVISLFSLGGPTLALSDHGDHIHVGYAC